MTTTTTSNYPVYTQTEALTRETFLALMWALSHPGTLRTLPESTLIPTAGIQGALLKIAATLLDLETTYFTPDDGFREGLHRTGARPHPAERAAYHFYPTLTADSLTHLALANIGTAQFPDQSATVCIGANFDAGHTLTLSGPGIQTKATVQVSGLPDAFWALRASAVHYPLGWDIFLIDAAGRVLGLPRSTRVVVKET